MNRIHFALFCQIILVLISVGSSYRSVIQFELLSNNDRSTRVRFQATNQKLANKHLPIWTVHKDNPNTLSTNNVMQEIGSFTMYQDPETSAAAVFFHDRLQFDGIIDSRYIIEGLFWNPLEFSQKAQDTTAVTRREPSRFYSDIFPEGDSSISVHLQAELPEDDENDFLGESIQEMMVTRVRRSISDIVYIETLVFVNFDIVEELQEKLHDYTSVVSYILTLFNNVDMLFSKVKDPIIRFNIAGIIIGNSRESFPLYVGAKCHEQIEDSDKNLVDNMNVRCINGFIKTFCHQHEREIPSGTFDIAVILTRYGLHHYQYDPKTGDRKLKRVGGVAESPRSRYYELRKAGTMPTLVATVSDRGGYESFPVLAHELAHLFTVEHDSSLYEKHNLMQPNGKYNSNSLSWSRASIEQLKLFFRSPDACIFRTQPGSLLLPGPRHTLNADEQCQCYGYKAAKIHIRNRIRGRIGASCGENIQCKDESGTYVDGPVYMDGTSCNRGKVCWVGECVHINKRNSCFYLN